MSHVRACVRGGRSLVVCRPFIDFPEQHRRERPSETCASLWRRRDEWTARREVGRGSLGGSPWRRQKDSKTVRDSHGDSVLVWRGSGSG